MGKFILNIRSRLLSLGVAFLIVMGTLMIVFNPLHIKSLPQKDVSHQSLLDIIARGESKGNYNAYYGNAGNNTVEFTNMTINEVLAWQEHYVNSGSPSSAVGKYQFIRPTLTSLVNEYSLSKEARFDEELQDRLAVALLERRGLNEYIGGKISREQFAHSLSKEWAALPKTVGNNPSKSFYEGDGLNSANTSVDEVYKGIEKLEKDVKEGVTQGLRTPDTK